MTLYSSFSWLSYTLFYYIFIRLFIDIDILSCPSDSGTVSIALKHTMYFRTVLPKGLPLAGTVHLDLDWLRTCLTKELFAAGFLV